MTNNAKQEINAKPLYDASRAARYAAKVWLPEDAQPGQVRALAEDIYKQAAAQTIAQGKFTLPDRPMENGKSHAQKVSESRDGDQEELGLG